MVIIDFKDFLITTYLAEWMKKNPVRVICLHIIEFEHFLGVVLSWKLCTHTQVIIK